MSDAHSLEPRDVAEACEAVRAAAARDEVLEIRGGGSKAPFGAPRPEVRLLRTHHLAGVIDYDPRELVITVAAGTPLREVEDLLETHGQMLAFEPFEAGTFYGTAGARATIGGTVAAAIAGPRRLSAGGARDHLLGFEAVSGRGERFVAGAKVVKNVTGYDVPKVMAASWGRLALLTELTLKVVPRPPSALTIRLAGLSDTAGVRAMSAAMASAAVVAAAAHLPDTGEGASTMLRLEGFEASLQARALALSAALSDFGSPERLDPTFAAASWFDVRTPNQLAEAEVLWRVLTPASAGADLIAALGDLVDGYVLDWAGGLQWIGLPASLDPERLRRVVASLGGHATLVRAPEALKQTASAFHPEPSGVAELSARVRAAFDPSGVFQSNRFSGGSLAH
jgi:glycolate oxidase FAD binding subunit